MSTALAPAPRRSRAPRHAAGPRAAAASSARASAIATAAAAFNRGFQRGVQARYDAAETTPDNRRHWSAAGWLSADAEASPDVRRTLRARARYEVANNSYARGIVLTLANDMVGTGPALQVRLPDEPELCAEIEHDFETWSQAIGLPEKLRTVRMARAQDGEAFALFVVNPRVPFDAVALDLQLVEADRVCGAYDAADEDPQHVDGIRYDRFGNPLFYRVLNHHPGSPWGLGEREDSAIEYPASAVAHLFREDRPGQHRGVPELTPALPLFAQLRRYTLAVLSAAESAADFAAVLYTDMPPDTAADVKPLETIALERNLVTTLPEGWKMGQLDAKQPASNYAEFKKEILNEIARCLNIPFNVAAGNSSGYNYASGRLDHQVYFRSLRVEQDFTERRLLDPLFRRWLREWSLYNNRPLDAAKVPFVWYWDGQEHVDPNKEARAQAVRLANLTTTLSTEYAKQGKDWEAEVRQIAKERALLKELDLPQPGADPGDALDDESANSNED